MVRHAARALAAVALVLCGCGEESPGRGSLEWKADPIAQVADGLPQDRVVSGTVRNVSVREDLAIEAADLKVRDSAGRDLRTFAVFAAAYAHGLHGAYQKPGVPDPAEERRLGRVVSLRPGKEAPLVVAYRVPKGVEPPLRLVYPGGELRLPPP